MSPPLAGRVALVTGASGGIGSATCRCLAGAGARVVVTYRSDRAGAEALEASLPGEGHLVAPLEVTERASLDALAKDVAARFGQLDLLVNNAAVTRRVPHDDLEGLEDAFIDEIFRVNWRGPFAAVRAFRGLLAASEGGLVVNLSSVAGQTGLGSNVAYCASKAALDSMTRSLARSLAPRVRVVSVAPGWVAGAYAARTAPGVLEAEAAKTPLGRVAQAEDVAQAVLAAATTLRFSTGCVLPVDGGRPLYQGELP